VRWLIVFWIFIVSATAYLDRVNISIAGRAIAQDFHLNSIQLGWVFSAFVIGYAICQTPAGRLADRLGPRVTLTAGVIWWCIFTALLVLLPAGICGILAAVLAVRFLLGAGEAVVYPASNCAVAAWVPSAERGIANGIIFTGVGFGAAVTSPLIAYIMMQNGWRAAFWVSSAVGLAVGSVWFWIARDTPAQHPWVSPEERRFIAAGLPKTAPTGSRLSWAAILGNRDILAITLSYFAYGYAAYIFFSWFFIYLNAVRGLDLRQSSYYTMLPFVAMALGSLVGGWLSDRIMQRRGKRWGRCGIAIFGMALAAIFMASATRVASAHLATFALAGGAGALYLSQSSFWSVSADLGGSSAGSVSGLMNMGGQIGAAVTASLTPAIAGRFGWSASFLTAAGLCACGALLWITVNPEGKVAGNILETTG